VNIRGATGWGHKKQIEKKTKNKKEKRGGWRTLTEHALGPRERNWGVKNDERRGLTQKNRTGGKGVFTTLCALGHDGNRGGGTRDTGKESLGVGGGSAWEGWLRIRTLGKPDSNDDKGKWNKGRRQGSL